mmetsp:Transcript_10915/g.17885  ORF Transcript_10915/g.17885 Transcript_10915/m.17885 type:complete len:94 (+) Transcript_10915:388-669(+)
MNSRQVPMSPRTFISEAHGLANVLAIQDIGKDEKQIYKRLHEPDDAATPRIWINLPHLAIEDGVTVSAMYNQRVESGTFARDSFRPFEDPVVV